MRILPSTDNRGHLCSILIYLAAGVLNGTVYIDGGKFSYLSGGSVVYQYCEFPPRLLK